MSKNKNRSLVLGGTALVLALGLGIAAVGTSAAYISDTNAGGTATIDYGSISVESGAVAGEAPDLILTGSEGALPGEEVSASFTVTNTGQSTQDVWIKFDPNQVFNFLNQQGISYGDLVITVDGDVVFNGDEMMPGKDQLPTQLLLKEDLGATGTTVVTVSFTPVTTWQGAMPWDAAMGGLSYSIVATQPGIDPSGQPVA